MTLSYVYPGTFAMKRGALEHPTFAYETWGTLNAARDNAILIFTGLSPSAHAASSPDDPSTGWWEDMVGPDKPIDTTRFFVICVNSLGSCFGSTGPASINPTTNAPYRLAFPILHLEDIARGGAAVLDHLGIEVLHTVLGSSMGGMTVLAFAMLFPTRARGLVSISAAARSQPFAIAIRSLQRELIRSDPDWEQGNYPLDQGPLKGMRQARKLGLISYRSADEWAERFGRERAGSTQMEPGALAWSSKWSRIWRRTRCASRAALIRTAISIFRALWTCLTRRTTEAPSAKPSRAYALSVPWSSG